ncbi:MAG: serine hydrolase [Actinomycetota bacterium]|nr:serine hydrolase [Actinomycetota bacterium]
MKRLVDDMFAGEERYGTTYAVVIVHRGEVVAERYGGALPHFDRPPEPVTPATPLLSWSMANSILHAAVGVLVGDGRLDIEARAAVPEWADPADPRHDVTLDQLLAMRDGLDFAEVYTDDRRSNVIEMLFGSGQHDVAAYAASRPLAHAPGTTFNYSSGTSNILARIVGDVVGRGVDYEQFLRSAIFDPIGMTTALPRFDDAGNFIGSSYVYATARDFARFGRLSLRDGVTDDGTRILPEGWVAHGTTPRSSDPEDGRVYGAHWWVVGDDLGSFWASGYEGQSILVCPPLDLVAVRLGRSTEAHVAALTEWRSLVVESVSGAGPTE